MLITKFKGKKIKLTNKQVKQIATQDLNCHLWTIAAKSKTVHMNISSNPNSPLYKRIRSGNTKVKKAS